MQTRLQQFHIEQTEFTKNVVDFETSLMSCIQVF